MSNVKLTRNIEAEQHEPNGGKAELRVQVTPTRGFLFG
jgi:hypothetical protein